MKTKACQGEFWKMKINSWSNDSSAKISSKEHSGTGFCSIMIFYVFVMSLQEFENEVSKFNQRVEDLDRRLGTIFIQAFDDAPDLEHAFKVRTSREGATLCSILPHPHERRVGILFQLFAPADMNCS